MFSSGRRRQKLPRFTERSQWSHLIRRTLLQTQFICKPVVTSTPLIPLSAPVSSFQALGAEPAPEPGSLLLYVSGHVKPPSICDMSLTDVNFMFLLRDLTQIDRAPFRLLHFSEKAFRKNWENVQELLDQKYFTGRG